MTQPVSIAVRPARLEDLASICHWQCAMAWETESRRLDPERVQAGVRLALGDPKRGRYFIAERCAAPVGGLMLTTEWSDWRAGWFWWIQSVYVEPSVRERGVFRALYDHVRAEADASPEVCGLRLYVEKDNASAQEIYRRMGLHSTHYRLFELELSAP